MSKNSKRKKGSMKTSKWAWWLQVETKFILPVSFRLFLNKPHHMLTGGEIGRVLRRLPPGTEMRRGKVTVVAGARSPC